MSTENPKRERIDWWVYAARDAAGALLYVGMTGAGPRRLSAHSRDSEWAPLAATIAIEHFGSREAALARERDLINEHRPRFNIHGKPREPRQMPAGYVSVVEAAAIARTSERTIRRAIRTGDLIAEELGRAYAIRETELRSWVERSPAGPR